MRFIMSQEGFILKELRLAALEVPPLGLVVVFRRSAKAALDAKAQLALSDQLATVGALCTGGHGMADAVARRRCHIATRGTRAANVEGK